jgi:RimJ/RimL family protein N-acetyltransferase
LVTLRDFIESDAEQLVAILNDSDVTQYLSTKIPSPYSNADALWWINEGSRGSLIKAIVFNNKLIGCIGVNRGEFEYNRSGEIGYWLAKDYWRQGITSSAIKQIIDMTFTQTDIIRVFASVFSNNIASMQLLLKSGFEQEAILRNTIFKNKQFYDNHIFVIFKQS